jgi:hypothetical protein
MTGVALLAASCGGGTNSAGSSSSGGQSSHAQSQQVQQEVVRFAACMRSHGAPNLPDPTTSPHGFKESLNPSNAQSPAFQAALAACHYLLPSPPGESAAQTHAHTVALLAFARCLRSHGFPSFPDPTSSGQITHEMIASAGINLHQPAVLQSADACVGVTHGVITKAEVARFVAGQ